MLGGFGQHFSTRKPPLLLRKVFWKDRVSLPFICCAALFLLSLQHLHGAEGPFPLLNSPPPPPLHCFLSSLFFFSCQIFKQRFPFGWCAKQHSSSFTLSPLKIKRLTSISITKEETGSFCLRFQSVAVFLSFTPEEEKSCYYSKRN